MPTGFISDLERLTTATYTDDVEHLIDRFNQCQKDLSVV